MHKVQDHEKKLDEHVNTTQTQQDNPVCVELDGVLHREMMPKTLYIEREMMPRTQLGLYRTRMKLQMMLLHLLFLNEFSFLY